MNVTRNQLIKQFNSVKSYLPAIAAAAKSFGFESSLLLAIGSRETNFDPKYQHVPGDRGNGFSWWQIDKRSYPAFTSSGDWKDPAKAVRKSAQVLKEKLDEVLDLDPSGDVVRDSDTARRVAVAAYNCGSGPAFRNFKKYGDPDKGTTGKDYSADVLEREWVFADLLGGQASPVLDHPKNTASQPVVEQPKEPPPKEINAQTATTVNPSKPSIWGQISAISIPAGLTTALATIGKLFMGIPPWAWALIVVAGILAAAYLWDRKRQRAHERTLKIVDVTANPGANNVYIGEPIE